MVLGIKHHIQRPLETSWVFSMTTVEPKGKNKFLYLPTPNTQEVAPYAFLYHS
jgi:hypothetical protein